MVPPLLMALHTPPGPSPMWMIVLPGQIESGHDGVTQPLPQQMGSPPQSPWQPWFRPAAHSWSAPACEVAPTNAALAPGLALAHSAALSAAAKAAVSPSAAQIDQPSAHASAGTAHGRASPHAAAAPIAAAPPLPPPPLRLAFITAAPAHEAVQPRTFLSAHSASQLPSPHLHGRRYNPYRSR